MCVHTSTMSFSSSPSSASSSSSSSRAILTAFTVALGALCSAGSPCCGDKLIYEPRGTAIAATTAADGGISASECKRACEAEHGSDGYGYYTCVRDSASVDAGGDGGIRVECTLVTSYCSQPSGRRPRGFRDEGARGATVLGAYFAQLAALEAASVDAFLFLALDLRAHRAPRRLVRRALRAARDEQRHTAIMSELARAHGGIVTAPAKRAWRHRPLVEVARENAVEGCVRETFGALLATHQAIHAPSVSVREAMTVIAEDETRHAVLAHDVHRWTQRELDPAARRRVRRSALRARRELAAPPAIAEAGLPDARSAGMLASALHRALPLP